MCNESKVLAILSPVVARHLNMECRDRFGSDGFDTEATEDGHVRFIGPEYTRDFVEGFLAGLEAARSERLKAPASSGEFSLGVDPERKAR